MVARVKRWYRMNFSYIITQKPNITIILLVFGLIVSCKKKGSVPSYLVHFPIEKEFEYIPVSYWNTAANIDTVVVDLWNKKHESNQPVLQSISDIAEVASGFWITDPLEGIIAEFNSKGQFKRIVAGRGKGPDEVFRPASIYVSKSNNAKPDIYVLDTGTKSLIRFNQLGEEKNRMIHKSIDRNFFNNWLIVSDKNISYWPTYNLDKHVVVGIDSTGKLVESLVSRIIPRGYQPMTYNGTVFDLKGSGLQKAYAYKGIPVLFTETQTDKYLINFLPETDIDEINTPLKNISENKKVTVKSLVKDLYYWKDYLFVLFKNKLIVASQDGKYVKGYHLKSETDDKIGFHKMVLTDTKLFVINRSILQVYTIELRKILSKIPKTVNRN